MVVCDSKNYMQAWDFSSFNPNSVFLAFAKTIFLLFLFFSPQIWYFFSGQSHSWLYDYQCLSMSMLCTYMYHNGYLLYSTLPPHHWPRCSPVRLSFQLSDSSTTCVGFVIFFRTISCVGTCEVKRCVKSCMLIEDKVVMYSVMHWLCVSKIEEIVIYLFWFELGFKTMLSVSDAFDVLTKGAIFKFVR